MFVVIKSIYNATVFEIVVRENFSATILTDSLIGTAGVIQSD